MALVGAAGLGFAIPFAVAGDHSPSEPSGPAKSGQIRIAPVPNLAQCSFLKRRTDIPFLKERWHLDALGADLMAEHPAVKNAAADAYANHALAIVDTGLKLNGNPAAGSECGLSAESPEKEYQYHGTHVAGIAGSKTYGVNCRLRVISYPTKYHERTSQKLGGMTFGAGNEYNRETKVQGFDPKDLSRQIRAAADNPEVSVISLSIGFSQDPKTQADIQYAISKGKWLVFANSNDGKLNSRETANLRNFLNRPELFAVGGYSYFGGPYHGSDYGPGVRFYTPASEVQSLDTRYNPNLVEPQTGISFSGTSMATPALAAVLTTLKVVDPKLSAVEADEVLSISSILRGQNPPMRMLNGYHAVELLTRARTLHQDAQCTVFTECLSTAEAAIRDEGIAAASHPPRYPSGNSCEEWERAYQELRKGYFLSNGKLFGDRIREILAASRGEKWAENAYYLGGRGEKKNLSEVDPPKGSWETIKKEYRTAEKFLRGELLPASDLPKQEQESLLSENPTGFLARLPAIPENLHSFLKLCRDFLETSRELPLPSGRKETDDRVGCADFMGSASRTFLVALGREIESGKIPLANPNLPDAIDQLATDASEKELAKRLLQRAAENWKNTGNVEDLDTITKKMEWLTPSQRAQLLADFLRMRGSGDLTETTSSSAYVDHFSHYNLNRLASELRSWAPAEDFKNHEELVELGLTPYVYTDRMHHAHPDVGRFIAAVRRVQAGQGDPRDVAGKLVQLIHQKDDEDRLGKGFTHELAPRDPFISDNFTKAIENPETAKELAAVLADPIYFEGLCHLSAYPFVLVSRLLAKTNDKRLLDTAILAWDKQVSGSSHGKKQELYQYLEAISQIPLVKALKQRIENGPQPDAVGKIARSHYLTYRAENATGMIPEVQQFLSEGPGTRTEKLLRVSPSAIVAAPELLRELGQRIESPDTDAAAVLKLVSKASQDSFPQLSSVIGPHLGLLLQRLDKDPYSTQKDLRQLAHLFVNHNGGDPERMRQLYGGLESALAKQPAKGSKDYVETKDKQGAIVELAQILAQSRAGLTALEERPELVTDLADRIARKFDENLLAHREPIPQPIKVALRSHFPSVTELNGLSVYTNWVEPLVAYDVESLDRAVAALKSPELRNGFGKKMLQRAIRASIALHPEAAERTLASIPVGLLPLENTE